MIMKAHNCIQAKPSSLNPFDKQRLAVDMPDSFALTRTTHRVLVAD